MRRLPRFRTPLISLVVLLSVALLPQAAAAASFSGDVNYDVPGVDVCGIDTIVNFSGTTTFYFPPVRKPDVNTVLNGAVTLRYDVTFTGVESGISTSTTESFSARNPGVSDLGGGFYRLSYEITNTWIVLTLDGNPHIRDAGGFVLFDDIHLGDLTTGEDDYFVSEIFAGFIDAPPVGNDGSDFCTQFIAYMGG
jgi:hypothetical protein